MGATWMSGCSVSALRDPTSGQVFYAAFEKTTEANVFPRKPHWSAVAFGTGPQIMERAVHGAGSCVGGMLRNGNGGYLAPQQYLALWRRALAAPLQASASLLKPRLTFGAGLYDMPAALHDEFVRQFGDLATLVDDGRRSGKQTLEVDLGKPVAAAALSEFFRIRRANGASVWRAFASPQVEGAVDKDLAYAPPRLNAVPADLSGYAVVRASAVDHDGSADQHLLVTPSGVIPCGWDSQVRSHIIEREVTRLEREHPGCAEAAMAAFDEVIGSAAALSPATSLVFHIPEAARDSYVGRELREAFEHEMTGERLEVSLAQLQDPNSPSLVKLIGYCAASEGAGDSVWLEVDRAEIMRQVAAARLQQPDDAVAEAAEVVRAPPPRMR